MSGVTSPCIREQRNKYSTSIIPRLTFDLSVTKTTLLLRSLHNTLSIT